ncbi:MAG: prefoldin subunit alpha [Thermoprotei archaeon]|nr:MAG: prefoldin subunit alpha [Thermoprotei archaeon]
MSEPESEVRSLVEQLEALKNYVNELQSRLQVALSELEEVRLARTTLTHIRESKDRRMLVALDRRGHALVYAELKDLNNVVLALGGDLYAKVPLDKAIEVLLERERELERIASGIEGEIKKVTNLYNELAKKLQKQLSSSQMQQR